MKRIAAIVCLVLLITSPCLVFGRGQSESVSAGDGSGESTDLFAEKVTIEYSAIFDVEYHGNYKIVTVKEPWPGASSGFTYLLVQKGTQKPAGVAADKVIEVPVDSLVSMSTSYLPHLESLGLLDKLIAVDAFAWVSSPAVLKRIDEGAMKEVGSGPTVNVELLVEMEPDLIMAYGQGGEWDTHPKLEEAKLPYVINAEWNEGTPLARAEWVKFMAVFFNAEAKGNEIFDRIETEYLTLAAKAKAVTNKPTVFTGAPYQGTWWIAGGASHAARLLADAGANYIWADDDSSGSLMLDVETVFAKAGEAEYWLNTGYWNSLAEVKAADERFPKFAAFKAGSLYNNNLRMSPGGGNDYFESGPANPNIVLADLIKIFHPELVPEHEFYYYKKLD